MVSYWFLLVLIGSYGAVIRFLRIMENNKINAQVFSKTSRY